jgi:hypothetical protein
MELSLFNHVLIFDLPPENIAMLVTLWFLTFASYFYLRKARTDRMTELGNFETLKEVHGHKTSASPAVLGMKIVIVTLLFLAATGSVEYQSNYPVQNTDYVFAVDTSPSMGTPDYEPDRLGFSKNILNDYIQRLPGESEKTVVEFSGTVTVESSATQNTDETLESLNGIETDLENPGSSLATAVELGVDALQQSEKNRHLIIVTDGHTSSPEELSQAGDYASERNVRVSVIGLEADENLDELYRGLDENLTRNSNNSVGGSFTGLQALTQKTDGEYFSAYSEESFNLAIRDMVMQEEQLGINSDYFIMIFISLLVITEIWIYSRYGAI